MYLEVARSGDFKKLIKSGSADDAKCLEAWEDIVRRQEKETGTNQYNSLLALNKGYLTYLNDHTNIRASLILVWLSNRQEIDSRTGELIWVNCFDWDTLLYLKNKGYAVDTTNYESVIESIKINLHRCENLITRAVSKRKELEKLLKGKEESGGVKGFEEVLAHLNFSLGFNVDENITLARYNEYQKILRARQKAEENGRDKRK